jgi:hypothetical protein
MQRLFVATTALALVHCGANGPSRSVHPDVGGSSVGASASTSGGMPWMSSGGSGGSGGVSTNGTGGTSGGAGGSVTGGTGGSASVPPVMGGPGCGFEMAAFCDTFEGPSSFNGRGRELDATFWSASRTFGQFSNTHPQAIGLALIPTCRSGIGEQVWPDQDTLICDPVPELASSHLLVAAAAQFYGQNGYRIRQPFDFAGRTGTIVFDASTEPLSPVFGWISLAITEDPISSPGYAIYGNDEGSIIPKNAVAVHFINAGGDGHIGVRNVHVFHDHADTVYTPPGSVLNASHPVGKLNHFEVLVSQSAIEVHVSPHSENGVDFEAPVLVYTQPIDLPFSRGYVQLSLHNHASLKYSEGALTNASVARIDNVGFDGPVLANFREYEVPDALVEFNQPGFQAFGDPHNPENKGMEIGYFLNDAAQGPKQTLHFADVDLTGAASARVVVTLCTNFGAANGTAPEFKLLARFNGNAWRERQLTAAEAALDGPGPTTVDSNGNPIGSPASQGRLALMIDVPLEDLVSGENTLEFVTDNVPLDYPPVVSNIDLVLGLP